MNLSQSRLAEVGAIHQGPNLETEPSRSTVPELNLEIIPVIITSRHGQT
jgi:hypothetical protein